MRGITKRFPGVCALDDVTFEAAPAEVHGLVGENGAGKSTLLKIMSGVYRPDAGSIQFGGRDYDVFDPIEALLLGIAIIYQELSLIPDLSLAENVFAGRLPTRRGFVRWRKVYGDAREALAGLDLRVDPRTRIRDVGVGIQQMVEIARALSMDARLLLMDEPTSALTEHEEATLFQIIRTLRGRGVSVVYISHRLDEIFEVCDRITVLRDGARVATCGAEAASRSQVIQWMVGRKIESVFPKEDVEAGEVALSVKGLAQRGRLHDVSFDVRRGEIVGIAGMMGAGRTELARAVFGADPIDEGEILVEGRPVPPESPSEAIGAGIALVTENRRDEGLFLEMTTADNVTYPVLRQLTYLAGLIRTKRKREIAARQIDDLDITPRSGATTVGTLSGGNQQKVVLGKWLSTEPRIIILDEPTRGVDVGAKAEIHGLMSRLAKRGAAILMISSELPEILGMSDRILVMRDGRIVKELSREEATQARVMHYALADVPTPKPDKE